MIDSILQSQPGIRNQSNEMLGLIVCSSHVRVFLIFFYTRLWIPLLHLKEAVLRVAGILSLASPADGPNLPVRRYEEVQRLERAEEMCAICLTEFAREDAVRQIHGCDHVFHVDCIEKWMERRHFTCPLCRCFFSVENRTEKFHFVVPDNPSCLYYFLQ